VSPPLAAVVQQQLSAMRAAVAELVPDGRRRHAGQIAEAFVAVCSSYSQQLAIRGDLDPAPYTAALMAIIKG
jgi:TetR/AcrR family transcriptional regulator, transcriptional repressor of aconitase